MAWIGWGSLLGAVAVATGAFAAHALQGRWDAYALGVWDKAVRYHSWHAVAMLVAGLVAHWAGQQGRPEAAVWANRAGWGFAVGVVLFSGSLYLLAATGMRKLGMVTPLGGVAFMVAWMCLAVSGFRLR
jgi:uncharacterized membrane protein YgdD (TMEM256/DUF423 family)